MAMKSKHFGIRELLKLLIRFGSFGPGERCSPNPAGFNWDAREALRRALKVSILGSNWGYLVAFIRRRLINSAQIDTVQCLTSCLIELLAERISLVFLSSFQNRTPGNRFR